MNDVNLIVIGVIAGAITGLSGMLIGSFTMFFATKNSHKQSPKKATISSLISLGYLALYVLCIGLGVALFFDTISFENLQAVSIAMPLLAITLGLLFVRRYFWHTPLVHITHHKKHLAKRLKQQHSVAQPMLIAATLFYASAPIVLANIVLLALLGLISGSSALYWSVAFTIGFITPLYIVIALLNNKTNAAQLLKWQDSTQGTSFLYVGLWCIFLAWLVLYYVIVNGAYLR